MAAVIRQRRLRPPPGVHPPQRKGDNIVPIRPMPLPERLIVQLSQHIGAPAEPQVAVGERVLKGQRIAESPAMISAPLHAPTSGRIEALEARALAHASGQSGPCLIIAPDGEEKWAALPPPQDYRQMSREALLERVRLSGVAGLGGAGFPTAPKLASGDGGTIETLIVNGIECEPYISADDSLMREEAASIVEGIRIVAHLTSPREVIVAIEDNKPEAIEAMRRALDGSDYELVATPTQYPSGGERQLIEMLLDKQVPSGALPVSIGVLCQNVGTLAAICHAVREGRPLISRVTTLAGDALERPGNYRVLIGTPVKHLLEVAGLRKADMSRLIVGGPMMGFAISDLEAPIVKSANCLIAATREEMPPPKPARPCIRCGLCDEVCPARLLPQQLYRFARADNREELEKHDLFDCIECGACSWICPSKIPLVQYYRYAKGDILYQRELDHRAELSKVRFDMHQKRLEREKAERERQREERKRKRAAESAAIAARKVNADGAGEDGPEIEDKT